VPFSVTRDDGTTVTGVTLSNAPVAEPVVGRGYPVQINSRDLPGHAIALTIVVETRTVPDGHVVAVPPLDYPEGWRTSSSFPDTPYMRTSWFRVGGTTFAVAVKVGPRVAEDDRATLTAAIQSIRAADI
jgi:hypothetical protein